MNWFVFIFMMCPLNILYCRQLDILMSCVLTLYVLKSWTCHKTGTYHEGCFKCFGRFLSVCLWADFDHVLSKLYRCQVSN